MKTDFRKAGDQVRSEARDRAWSQIREKANRHVCLHVRDLVKDQITRQAWDGAGEHAWDQMDSECGKTTEKIRLFIQGLIMSLSLG